MPGGRPTDYRPEYCEKAVAWGRKGWSRAEIANGLDVARNTVANWEAVHPEFLSAMSRARDASLAWWEAQGRNGLGKGHDKFNHGLYAKCMAGRFADEDYNTMRHRVGGMDGGAVPLRFESLTDTQLANFIERLNRPGAERADAPADPGDGAGGTGAPAEGQDL